MDVAIVVEGNVLRVVGHSTECLAPILSCCELEAVVSLEVAGNREAAILRIATGGDVLKLNDTVGLPVPSTPGCTDHIDGSGIVSLGLLLEFVGERVAYRATCELEGEGHLVLAGAVCADDVRSTRGEVLLVLCPAEVGVGLDCAFCVESDLPSCVVSELEVTVVTKLLSAKGVGGTFVGKLTNLERGEAPAVHTATHAVLSLGNENLSVVKFAILVEVENDVIEGLLCSLHLRSVVAFHKSSLKNGSCRVAVIDTGKFCRGELCELSTVLDGPVASLPSEGELLVCIENDVLLEHTVTSGLIVGLVCSGGHCISSLELVAKHHIDAVLNDIVDIVGLVRIVLLAAGESEHCHCGNSKK